MIGVSVSLLFLLGCDGMNEAYFQMLRQVVSNAIPWLEYSRISDASA